MNNPLIFTIKIRDDHLNYEQIVKTWAVNEEQALEKVERLYDTAEAYIIDIQKNEYIINIQKNEILVIQSDQITEEISGKLAKDLQCNVLRIPDLSKLMIIKNKDYEQITRKNT